MGGAATPRDFDLHAAPTPDELRFLESNDISRYARPCVYFSPSCFIASLPHGGVVDPTFHRGHRFQEEKLPSIKLHDASQPSTQPQTSSLPTTLEPPTPLSPLPESVDKPSATEVQRKSAEPAVHSNLLKPHTPPRSPSSSQSSAPEPPHQDLVTTTQLAPREAAATEEVKSKKAPSIAAEDSENVDPIKSQTAVPLSAKEDSLRQLHKDRKEPETSLSVSIDAVSSPSSTAGAYSNSTPKPAQHSPDTSPDGDVSPSHQLDVPEPDAEQARLRNLNENGDERQYDGSRKEESNTMTEAQPTGAQQDRPDKNAESTSDSSQKVADKARPGILRNGTLTIDTSTSAIATDGQAASATALNRDVEMKDGDSQAGPTAYQFATPTTARTSMQDQTPQRMTTRVASGAIRQKSVTELLGGTPRSAHPERASISSQGLVSAPKSSARSAPGTPIEDRSRMPLVVFSKRDKDRSPKAADLEEDGYLALRGAADDLEKDYMRPLFLQQAFQPPRANPLNDLVTSANKTITTSNVRAMLKERTDYNVLRRIYTMQNANKWSLRQMKKFPDPAQPPCHWDHLMAEMKWMRTDFREERKWKMAVAQNLAYWCSMYVAASDEDKQHLRVKVRPPRTFDSQDRMDVDDDESTPPLVHSGTTESDHSSIEELPRMPTVAPTALFGLGYDDYAFELDHTPAADGVLAELPMFEPKVEPLQAREDVFIPASKFATGKILPKPETPPMKRSRYDYEEEEYEPTVLPPAKRRASEVSLFLSPSRRSPRLKELPAEESDVALFNPINRHMRQRLRDNVAFRPPSEFVMPQTSFFEYRVPSQWTWDEDQHLRSCVRNYSYNWSLISMEMQQFTQSSMLVAGTERRTPWECFERWVQLEGLPTDMGKTQYFRTYQNRLELANKLVAEKRPQQLQQVQTPGQPAHTRARGTQPFRVERRREGRYVTMIDAIRKLARKRETIAHRQQESAKAAALRKQQQQENQQPRQSTIHTPAEFSRMKYERDLKIQERQEQYRQQVLQQQRVRLTLPVIDSSSNLHLKQMQQSANQVQRQQQALQAANMANRQTQSGTPTSAGGPSPPTASMPAPNQQQNPPAANGSINLNLPRPSSSQGQLPNGLTPNATATMAGMQSNMPAAQMQALMQQQQMQNRQQMANQQNPEAIRLMMQQRALIQQQQQGLIQGGMGGHSTNLAAAHLSPAANMQNQQMMATLAAAQRGQGQMNGMGNGMGGANQTSPRINHVGVAGTGQLSSGHTPTINTIMNQVHAQNPNLSAEQVRMIAQDRLKGYLQRVQQQAAAAAAGNSPINTMANMNMMGAGMNMGMGGAMANMGMMNGMGGAGMNGLGGPAGMGQMPGATGMSPQQYQARLQVQQQMAVARGMAGGAGGGPQNMGGLSPAMGQGQGGMSRSATPAQGHAMMHTRSGSGAGLADLTGSPLLQ